MEERKEKKCGGRMNLKALFYGLILDEKKKEEENKIIF